MRALYVLWAIVALPVVAILVSLPFVLMAMGVSMVFNIPLPEVPTPTREQMSGLMYFWFGLVILAGAVTFGRDIINE